MKIKAIPFVFGSWISVPLFDLSPEFAIAATIIFTILVLTKTTDLI